MKKKRKYIYHEKCLIIRILQIYIFSFYDFLFFISLSYSEYALDFINDMRKIDPFIVEAFETLGKERIEELKYVEKKIREEMILTQRKGNKVVRLVKNIFKVGNKYSNEKIVNELMRIFEMLKIHPEENIEPKLIMLYYQAAPCWVGKKRGYQLISEKF